MRVIAGTARSMPLRTVKGLDTRPTTDKTKETLFNILQPDIPGCHFLDLFSGSGSIAIEALSRGAEHAVLVEQDSRACACILENLRFTKLIERGELQKCSVLTALQRMEGQKPFDIIFMDPPYNQDLERQVLTYLTKSTLADEETMIVVEASLRTDFTYLEELGYRAYKYKKYKTSQHVFIAKDSDEEGEENDSSDLSGQL
ncbi:MAG: 16S rRNA (guanine(966)-N(2))-methyltransferase RsmD [Lachnospiraceae bacterium]|nr:16S rRNA (guanine(966)-N(2))-methyltransferase RsmD [Lachnospiraceae bacterium]